MNSMKEEINSTKMKREEEKKAKERWHSLPPKHTDSLFRAIFANSLLPHKQNELAARIEKHRKSIESPNPGIETHSNSSRRFPIPNENPSVLDMKDIQKQSKRMSLKILKEEDEDHIEEDIFMGPDPSSPKLPIDSSQIEIQITNPTERMETEMGIQKGEVSHTHRNILQSQRDTKLKQFASSRSTVGLKKLAEHKHRKRIREALDIEVFIILPEDRFKVSWGAVIILFLFYATLITPYRIAFVDHDTLGWIITDCIVDFVFLIDLVLNFFFAYYNEDEELIYDRKKIGFKYLRGWFFVDFIACIPFNIILRGSNQNYNSLLRISRLPRLYSLLKLTKILRAIRLCRERNNWFERIERHLPRLGVAGERLLSFVIVLLVLCHVQACLWYLVAKIEGIYPESWIIRYGFQDKANVDIYTAGVYFTITTITTVGYGDISPGTTVERWFGIFGMLVGVLSYTFVISSVTSMLTTDDKKETKRKEALDTLHRIDMDCDLDTNLFLSVRKAIAQKFKQVGYLKENENLINLLTRELKKQLNSALHAQLVHHQLPIFEKRSSGFKNYLSSLLKPRKYQADSFIYQEGNTTNEIYFILKGKVEYVLPRFNDTPYMNISEGLHFGDLDFAFSILNDTGVSGTRLFTAKAKEDCEILILNQTDLFRLFHKYEKETVMIFEGADQRLMCILEQKERVEKGLTLRLNQMNTIFRLNTSSSPTQQVVNPTKTNREFKLDLGSSEDLSMIESMLSKSSNDIITDSDSMVTEGERSQLSRSDVYEENNMGKSKPRSRLGSRCEEEIPENIIAEERRNSDQIYAFGLSHPTSSISIPSNHLNRHTTILPSQKSICFIDQNEHPALQTRKRPNKKETRKLQSQIVDSTIIKSKKEEEDLDYPVISLRVSDPPWKARTINKAAVSQDIHPQPPMDFSTKLQDIIRNKIKEFHDVGEDLT